jgi:Xaa-Pro aminopeptidase
MATKTPETSPRGTERVRRRAAQNLHAAQAKAEGANLTSRKSPEKTAAIAKAKEAQVARFGPTAATRRQAVQTENKVKADREAATLAAAPEVNRPKLVPGEQPSLLTLRRMAKANDKEERDDIRRAATAAGIAVRDTLKGLPMRDRHSRFKRIAQHEARVTAQQTG